MITGQTKILSDIEVETFERDGVLVPHYRLPKDKLMLLQELADKLIAENPAMGDELRRDLQRCRWWMTGSVHGLHALSERVVRGRK